MSQPQRVWSESYKISSYLVNLRGRAGLYSVLNLIQDVGWLHAFHLKVKIDANQGWVFTRQKLVMHEWPKWNETMTIRTWLRPPKGAFLFRDYEVLVGDSKIGEATASFTVIDLKTRKSVQVDWTHMQDIWHDAGSVGLQPEKISLNGSFHELAQFQVRNSDLDMNNHVNNTKYAQWILDSLPLDMLRAGTNLHSYEVNFLAEAKSGDHVAIQEFDTAAQEGPVSTTTFQGTRISDGKSIFTARLQTSPEES